MRGEGSIRAQPAPTPTVAVPTPADMSGLTIADVQAKYLTKLAQKTKGGLTERTVKKNLGEFVPETQTLPDGVTKMMDFPQFKRSLETAGNALTEQEAMFLFSFWDTCAGQQEPCGWVPVPLAVDDLIQSSHGVAKEQQHGNVFKSGEDRFDKVSGGGGNLSNRSSLGQGGIFGGGAYEADAGGKAAARAQPPPVSYPPPGAVPGAEKPRPRGNQSSISGGIFGGEVALASQPPSAGSPGGNKSNRSSIPGGIFAEPAPIVAPQRGNKFNSNASSIPGGIFG